MKASAAVNIVFNEQQNKFRGLISEFKSHKFVKDRTTHPSVRFRSHLRELLLEARISLQTSQFDNYLSWINHQIEAQLVGMENSAIALLIVGFFGLPGSKSSDPWDSILRHSGSPPVVQ